ncbi:zinc-ribbon domain-containing protein [Dermacoccaceae bacterium W4C1]
MKYCTQCGQQSSPEVKFCTNCGAPLTQQSAPLNVFPQQQATGATPAAGSTPPKKKGGGALAPLLVIGVALLALAVVAATMFFNRDEGDEQADPVTPPSPVASQSAPSPTTPEQSAEASSSTPDSSASGTPTDSNASGTESGDASAAPSSSTPIWAAKPTSNAQALDILNKARNKDVGEVDLNGKWAAQVASQDVGAEDESLQPGPMDADDILRYHQQWRTDPRTQGREVILLKENDFGKIERDKNVIWMTMVLLQAGSRSSVEQWCASTFSMTVADAKNVCKARQMVPAHN